MNHQKAKLKNQLRRRNHVRRSIVGTAERPRLSVFRSSKHIYAQLIDDLTGVTLAAASSVVPDIRTTMKHGGNIKAAQAVGKKIAEVAKGKGIDKAAFDRGHYKFHGRVKAVLAEAATLGGLICCNPEKIGVAKAAPVEAKAAEQKASEKKAKKDKKAEGRESTPE